MHSLVLNILPNIARLVSLVPILVIGLDLLAGTPNGVWLGFRPMGGTRTEPITFRISLKGTNLEGSVRTGYGEVPMERANWNGREFHFFSHMVFVPSTVEDEYQGTINGDEFFFTVVRDGLSRRNGSGRRISDNPEPYARAVPISTPPKLPLLPDGLAPTPPMGWSSWNCFGTKISDRALREIADALVSTGLRDAGYVYVNIDDGWEGLRDSAGEIHPNTNFPDMKGLADYVHSRGLKFGIYSSPGPNTCAGFEGSAGHEEQDALTWAGWGVDYIKYDWCSGGLIWDLPQMGEAYRKMSLALRATKRPIVHSLCQYGLFNVQEWGAAAGGHLWRTTGDIGNSWDSVAGIAFNQKGLEKFAGPGHWNDPDMLEIGNGGMNAVEERSHMTLWAMLAAPLLLGNDVRKITPETLAVLTNHEVIEIDQDPLGQQGSRSRKDGMGELWVKPLTDGGIAVAIFNRGTTNLALKVDWKEIGITNMPAVRDLWQHEDLGRVANGLTEQLGPHASMLFRLMP